MWPFPRAARVLVGRVGDAAKQLLHRDAPSQRRVIDRETRTRRRPGIQPWGNDEAATQVAKSSKPAPIGKPCSVVVFWMLAFANMTNCSSRAARGNATGDRHGQLPAPLNPQERREERVRPLQVCPIGSVPSTPFNEAGGWRRRFGSSNRRTAGPPAGLASRSRHPRLGDTQKRSEPIPLSRSLRANAKQIHAGPSVRPSGVATEAERRAC